MNAEKLPERMLLTRADAAQQGIVGVGLHRHVDSPQTWYPRNAVDRNASAEFDGAIFIFANTTNPELLLLIEARRQAKVRRHGCTRRKRSRPLRRHSCLTARMSTR